MTGSAIEIAKNKKETLRRREERFSDVAGEPWGEPAGWLSGGEPELPRLPLENLPSALRAFVQTVSSSTQTPAEVASMLVLGALSAACNGRLTVRTGKFDEPVQLYTCAIMEPGTRKSAVFRPVMEPIQDFEKEKRKESAKRSSQTASDLRAAQNHLDRTEKDEAATDEGLQAARERHEIALAAYVPRRTLITEDATQEGLSKIMEEQGGRISLLSPEGDWLQNVDGRHSSGVASAAVHKKGHTRETITVHRKKSGDILIETPSLTIATSIQPGVLESMQQGQLLRQTGFYARFLWVKPPHGLGTRKTGRDVPSVDKNAVEVYNVLIRYLLNHIHEREEVLALSLSPEAKDVFYQMEGILERRVADDGDLAGIRDWAGKMCGAALRIAALFACVNQAAANSGTAGGDSWGREKSEFTDGMEISRHEMETAVGIMEVFAPHALAVLGGAAPPRQQPALDVLRRLQMLDEDNRTWSSLWQQVKNVNAFRSRKELRKVLETLEQAGALRLVSPVRTGEPGRPRGERIQLHPDLA